MPIYAYRCESCGHAQDVLQKISDPVLTLCPACGAAAYKKQVTAAGFQLKGTGWYATDFRGGNNQNKAASDKGKEGAEGKDASAKDGASSSQAKPGSSDASSSSSSTGASDATTSAPSKPPSSDTP